MKFVKGMTRPPNAGRKVGSLNRKTLEFKKLSEDRGFIVVHELIELYHSTERADLKLEILKEMAKYSYSIPKEWTDPSTIPENRSENELTIEDILNIVDVTPTGKNDK